MATAAETTIVQAETIVANGTLDGDAIHTPGIFVHRMIEVPGVTKPIEKRTVRAKAA